MNSASAISRTGSSIVRSDIFLTSNRCFESSPSGQHAFATRGELVGVGASVVCGDFDEVLVREFGERLVEPTRLHTCLIVRREFGPNFDAGGRVEAGEDDEDVSFERRETMKESAWTLPAVRAGFVLGSCRRGGVVHRAGGLGCRSRPAGGSAFTLRITGITAFAAPNSFSRRSRGGSPSATRPIFTTATTTGL